MVAFANNDSFSSPFSPPTPPEGFPMPGPEFSPEEVVQFQLYALQHNEQPVPDSGIAAAFEFASPANRAQTGPLERFIDLVHNDSYEAMLNFVAVDFGQTKIDGDIASQPVRLTARDGQKFDYIFMLSRQTDGPYEGCWMTDAVLCP